jgi:hypothetical protein
MDRNIPRYEDNQKPEESRWGIIENYFAEYGFESIDLGPIKLKLNGPLYFPITNHFQMPRLRTAATRSMELDCSEGNNPGIPNTDLKRQSPPMAVLCSLE